MGKLTISMTMFNSKLLNYQRVQENPMIFMGKSMVSGQDFPQQTNPLKYCELFSTISHEQLNSIPAPGSQVQSVHMPSAISHWLKLPSGIQTLNQHGNLWMIVPLKPH